VSTRNNIIKLPGLVDTHVHLREPGATQKEDFESGTKAAIAGGYTQLLDMPNNNPPTVSPQALLEKEKLAKGRIWCDLGFNFGASPSSVKYFQEVKKNVFGLKIYMNATTGPLIIEKDKDLENIFNSWTSKVPIMVHAIGETLDKAIKLAKKYDKPLHVCHVTADQLKTIKKEKESGMQITCEVTPHHLFLNKSDEKRLKGCGIMKPPLLSKADQQKLWDNLDVIDTIATDHAPHTLEEKLANPPAFGVPGLETTLPLLFNAIAQEKLTTDLLIKMLATNPRRIFHLPEQKDTFVLVDFSETFEINGSQMYTKNKWTPFEGMPGRGRVKKVAIRGKVVFAEGEFLNKPAGKIIHPTS